MSINLNNDNSQPQPTSPLGGLSDPFDIFFVPQNTEEDKTECLPPVFSTFTTESTVENEEYVEKMINKDRMSY